MAPRLSLRALPTRVASTPLARPPLLPTTTPLTAGGQKRHAAPFFSGGGGDAPRVSASTESWIAKLKETHGDRWQAVYDESRARQARNAAVIREKHRQKAGGEDGGEARGVEEAEEAWVARLKARHGEDGWRAAYEEHKAAFEEGLAKNAKAAELLRKKGQGERLERQEKRKREKQAAKEAERQEKQAAREAEEREQAKKRGPEERSRNGRAGGGGRGQEERSRNGRAGGRGRGQEEASF